MLGMVSLLSLLVASQAVLGTAAIGGAAQKKPNDEVTDHVTPQAARASSLLGTLTDHLAGLRCDTDTGVRHSRFTASRLHDGPAVSGKFRADFAAP